MSVVGIIVASLVSAFIALNVFWRYAARVKHVPCPTSLSWLLELDVGSKRSGPGSVVEQLELRPGMRVADVGCGPGRLTIPIAEAVGPAGDVVALDLQQGMLDRLDRKIATAGVGNVRKILAGAGDGELPKHYFDRAILSTVLGEIPDRERALREIHDALKPGGFLLVFEVLGDPHYQRQAKVRELGQGAGFAVGEIRNKLLSYTMRLHQG